MSIQLKQTFLQYENKYILIIFHSRLVSSLPETPDYINIPNDKTLNINAEKVFFSQLNFNLHILIALQTRKYRYK